MPFSLNQTGLCCNVYYRGHAHPRYITVRPDSPGITVTNYLQKFVNEYCSKLLMFLTF